MDVAIATATTTSAAKTPEVDSETPTRIQPNKPSSISNGVLKRHHSYHHHHHHHISTAAPVVVSYKECLKNHAASLGGHALDGCGEFMPSPTATPTDPTSLKCAACGCHRNFHRREPDEQQPQLPAPAATTTHVIEYQPHHRHHPPPPPQPIRSPGSHSPPPISSSYYPSAPHMLLALSAGLSGAPPPPPPLEINTTSSMNLHASTMGTPTNPNGRKRFRTRFSQGQKEKMHEFAERVGWKMQKSNEEVVAEFCNEIGVDRGVLKVWMHNNKNTVGKRDVNGSANNLDNGNGNNNNNNSNSNNNSNENQVHHHNDSSAQVATNGSSSSS